MSNNLIELAYRLTQAGEPFVLATVVRCERPTSAKPGAQAIIQANGQITGWIGGSCAQPVVLREAARILRDGGDPYLLRLGTSETDGTRLIASDSINRSQTDVRVFPMSCASGGVLDIFMEPHLPQPQLLLVGNSPVIAALSRLAEVLDFAVIQLNSTDLVQVNINERTYVLVASHGQYDEDVLEHALRSSACYVGMVGSPKRGEAIRNYLRGSGLSEEQIARLRVPAGLDLGAVIPEEIAASILAELVQVKRHPPLISGSDKVFSQAEQFEEQEMVNTPETATDPVCGMIVEVASARHRSSYEGSIFYFCCPACKRLFEGDPQKYLTPSER